MSPSLRALLTGIVDYAGLFPPAQLSLDEAIRNYARYRTEHTGRVTETTFEPFSLSVIRTT